MADLMSNVPTLSPAAQAVLDAVRKICPAPADEIASAALRAAADQVVPHADRTQLSMADRLILNTCSSVRQKLLAIAAELEAAQ